MAPRGTGARRVVFALLVVLAAVAESSWGDQQTRLRRELGADGSVCQDGFWHEHGVRTEKPCDGGKLTTDATKPPGAPQRKEVSIVQHGDGFQWTMSSTTPGAVASTGDWPTVTVDTASKVTFTGKTGSSHQFAIMDAQGNPLAGPTKAGAFVVEWTPTTAGKYTYYCPPHKSFMKGVIHVQAAPERTTAKAPTKATATESTPGGQSPPPTQAPPDAAAATTPSDAPTTASNTILVIGDSIAELSHTALGSFCKGKTVVNHGVGGSTAEHWATGDCRQLCKNRGQPDNCCDPAKALSEVAGL